MKAWKKANRLKCNAQANARYAKNPEFFRAKNRLQYRKARAAGFDFHGKALRIRWGMSWENYNNLLLLQGGCAICGITKPKGKQRFHVDHDHSSGKIRGLLCSSCNLILGHAKDNVLILVDAINYLNRYTAISDTCLNDGKYLLKC